MRHVIPLLLIAATGLAAGDLSRRYQLTLERVLSGGPPRYDQELVVADVVPRPVRRFTEFSGDVSGRYIGALATAALETPQAAAPLDRVVAAVLQHQREDGHFGEPMSATEVRARDMALLWGNGRLLVGLLEDYQRSRRPEILAAATRLGDFLVRVAPILNAGEVRRDFSLGQFAVGYICWTQVVEGAASLYRTTGEERYRRLAEQLAARTGREPAQHSHGFLTSLRGVVDLYEAVHKPKYLAQAEKEWHGVIDSGNLLAQGAVPEFFAPNIRRDEGCAEADWLRLSLALWRLTGNPEYLEQAELTLFNEYALNEFASGDFGHRQLTEGGVSAQAAHAWWCCTLHGLRGFGDVFRSAFRAANGALYYDLPVDGHGRAGALEARADSSLEENGSIRLAITAAGSSPLPLPLRIRVPRWARSVAAEGASAREGYLELRRAWKAGDTVLLHYEMRTRALADKAGRVTIFHGPWLLGVDELSSPHFFDEPMAQNRVLLPPAAADGELELARANAAESPFAIPVAHFQLPYLPGGYPLQPQKAVLRPIAEQTGLRTTAWEFRFAPSAGAAARN